MNLQKNNPTRIGLLEDHPTFRAGIKTILDKKKSLNVVFEG